MDPFTMSRLMSAFTYLFLPSEKCIAELGCFQYVPPLFDYGISKILPQDRDVINTKFLLYTRKNPDTPQIFSNLFKNVSSVSKSFYNPKANTKFIVPGFMSDTADEWKKPMIDALVNDNGNNVFWVDWLGGDGPLYDYAVANTKVVGAEIALFIKQLEKIVGLKPQNVHIIGHSLGSHIAGFAGKRIKNLGRITGLDPAGPSFMGLGASGRLDRKDALFVDVIHTDMAPIVFTGFGLMESIGHVDFFPNGGGKQPGCEDMGSAVLSFITHPTDHDRYIAIQCDHLRVLYLFISSIQNKQCQLWGTVCDSWEKFTSGKCGSCQGPRKGVCIPLGIRANEYTLKTYNNKSINVYLNTTAKEPFCS